MALAQRSPPVDATVTATPENTDRSLRWRLPPPTTISAVLSAVAVTVAAGAAQVLAAIALPVPAGPAEAGVAANAFALVRTGATVLSGSLSDTVLSAQVAALSSIPGGSLRHDSVVAGVRELTILAVVVGAVAVFLAGRQLGFRLTTCVIAVLLCYVVPTLARAETLAFAGTVAVCWLLVAAVLLSHRRTAGGRPVLVVVAAVPFVALGVLSAPVVALIPTGLLTALLAGRLVCPHCGPVRWRLLTAASLGATVVVWWATVVGPWASGGDEVSSALAVGVGVGGLVVAAAAGWGVRWLRPLALSAVPILLATLWPTTVQGSAMVAALPLSALLLVGSLERAVARLPFPSVTLRRRVAAVLAAVLAVGLVGIPARAATPAPDSPAAELARWLPANVDAAAITLVDPLLWSELVFQGVDTNRLRRTNAVPPGSAPTLLVAPLGELSQLPLIARFGTGAAALGVRQSSPDPAATAQAIQNDREARARFGTALLVNRNIRLPASAAGPLRAGEVDARLLVVLTAAAAIYRFTVVALPSGSGDPGPSRVLRQVSLAGIVPVAPPSTADPGSAVLLRDFVLAQASTYRPLSASLDGDTLSVVYSAPSPLGLLP